MSWLNGASDLMTVVKSVYTGGSSIQNQDWGSLGASAGTIVGKGLIYVSKQNAVLANALKTSGTKMLPTPTAIVDAAAIALLVVDFLNGFGTPQKGAAVTTAADKFDLYSNALTSTCIPDSRDWSGPAAEAYTAQVKLLNSYVATMKEYDKALQGHLESQAAEIKRAHMTITVNVAVLTAAAGIALALYLIPIVGPEVSLAWQILAAFACCMAVFVIEMLTLANSMSITGEVTKLCQQYVALGKEIETKMAGTFGQIRGKVATETSSNESEFKKISGGLSAYNAPPSVSSLAAVANDTASPSQRALLDASAAQEEASVMASNAAETPDATPDPVAPVATAPTAAPASPVSFTPPSLGQVMQAAGAASRVSQNLSQPLNQTMQGVQQINQMSQQGQQSGQPSPATDDAATPAPTDETAAAGAASGTEGVRAPVDAPKAGTEDAAVGRGRAL